VTNAEQAKLLMLGARLGSRIKEVIAIVHPRTLARWLSEKTSGIAPRGRRRTRTPEQICQRIIEMAKTNKNIHVQRFGDEWPSCRSSTCDERFPISFSMRGRTPR
jgi:hypothetical protein